MHEIYSKRIRAIFFIIARTSLKKNILTFFSNLSYTEPSVDLDDVTSGGGMTGGFRPKGTMSAGLQPRKPPTERPTMITLLRTSTVHHSQTTHHRTSAHAVSARRLLDVDSQTDGRTDGRTGKTRNAAHRTAAYTKAMHCRLETYTLQTKVKYHGMQIATVKGCL